MVYLFLAEGFEEIEALTTVDILRRCGIAIQTVSVAESMEVAGAHGIAVKADKMLEDVVLEDAEALVLPGGMPGTDNLESCGRLKELLRQAYAREILIAAICAAPKILGAMGLLEGKCAVCFPGYEDFMTGAEVLTENAVVDGNIITSRGAGTAHDFAFEIARKLGKAVQANVTRESMLYDK